MGSICVLSGFSFFLILVYTQLNVEHQCQTLCYLLSFQEELKRGSSALYGYFEKIWKLKDRHLVTSSIPGNYMLMLALCNQVR